MVGGEKKDHLGTLSKGRKEKVKFARQDSRGVQN